ncbi:glycosyltransferase family 2 protein [Arthrobacter sp. UM1]|uniref:glycosyltransferase family 2 protein n=1 Tax=Arthrobacter sp. UM1 TaxID=2766776 RepID=UPI001CF63AFF|nr:glycosyltransferase [Arthrobacter sp. UM1]MCB4207985.1 glycosyltransferase family 2 protein [Arthrobacter sp. UM1]
MTLMKHALVVATVNRHETLTKLLDSLRELDPHPSELVISAPAESDIPPAAREPFPFPVVIALGARGSSAQRNKGVDALTTAPDTVAFLDDDSVPRRDFFARVERHFAEHPDSSAMTGRVVLEGTGRLPNLSDAEITEALERSLRDDAAQSPGPAEPHNQLYGCNMVFRLEDFNRFRFDERLPLYSWLEDTDLARALMKAGRRIYRDPAVVIAHRRDASGGRQSHVRFGYSFVSNWAHLHQKGHVDRRDLPGVVLVVGKNAVGSIWGPEREWRRLRLKGNLLALGDLLRGRVTPERILDL